MERIVKNEINIILEKSIDSIWGRVKIGNSLISENAATEEAVLEGIKFQLRNLKNRKDIPIEINELNLEELKVTYCYDLTQFFEVFNVLKISAFSKYCDINPSQLRQYVSGVYHPSEKQIKKIQNGLEKLRQDLSKIELI
ncbi:hypothetical protein ACWA1C_08285 [Flectobacillus roseus]